MIQGDETFQVDHSDIHYTRNNRHIAKPCRPSLNPRRKSLHPCRCKVMCPVVLSARDGLNGCHFANGRRLRYCAAENDYKAEDEGLRPAVEQCEIHVSASECQSMMIRKVCIHCRCKKDEILTRTFPPTQTCMSRRRRRAGRQKISFSFVSASPLNFGPTSRHCQPRLGSHPSSAAQRLLSAPLRRLGSSCIRSSCSTFRWCWKMAARGIGTTERKMKKTEDKKRAEKRAAGWARFG